MATERSTKLKIPLIGLLAVKNLLITKEELQAGVSLCLKAENPDAVLKDYFLANDLISPQNIERLLRAAKALGMRQKEFKFGAIAIRKGFINQSVLTLALEEQKTDIKNKKKVRRIGDMLVEAGMLTEKQCEYIFKLQKRVRKEVEKAVEAKGVHTGPMDAKKGQKKNQTQDTADRGSAQTQKNALVLLEPEVIDGGINLVVSNDFMVAFLSKTDEFDKNITLTRLKDALFDRGIVQGVVADEMLEGFIRSSGFKTKLFRVAKGISPIQGKDARVDFFFNIDYLKAGGLTHDGAIDFKDRGEIPHVEQGTVLAEKIPMVESRSGYTIYGDEIQMERAKDLGLKFGKGATLSEDGFKVMAAVNGCPKYSLSGHIFVHEEYVTQGDVDYETGHINYNGNVTIKGRIKSGFEVKGNDIKALELDGGSLVADGNINISGGINEGNIYCRGNVYAKFIHNSKLICMGDVIIQKEILDADVECSGSCVVESGKLMSSRITAKMGVKARDIGTQMGGPSMIKVGHDIFTERELEKSKLQIDQLNRQISLCQGEKQKFKQESLELQKHITELAHLQDRSQLEEKEIHSKIFSMGDGQENALVVQEMKKKIEVLKGNAQKAEEKLDQCFDQSDKLEILMEKEDKKSQTLGKQRDLFLEERANLVEWAQKNPGQTFVIVEGTIMPETIIAGRHSEKRVTELIRHAKIMEVLCSATDGNHPNMYEMQVTGI